MRCGLLLVAAPLLVLGACAPTVSGQSSNGGRADVPVAENATAPSYTKKRRGAATLSGGSGYHGSYLEGGAGLAAAAPAKPQKTRRAWRGLTPPPSGYPLLPGDEELWYSLTPAQQARALQFLEDGSTIRSSLKAD